MLGQLQHRGPDAFGIYTDPQAGLAHARLSILDLSGGDQPIHNEDQSLWVIYNGEIFNYPELREDLEKKGHRFYTRTDTEVLVHLYEDQGPEFLKQLNGQYALALWDRKEKSVFLARDRLGIRPLFYYQQGPRLVFASEIKALFADERIPRALDKQTLVDIFTCWAPLSQATAFQQIYQLLPGHYGIFSKKGFQTSPYWRMAFSSSPSDISIEESEEELKALLWDATRIRLRADVPVGAYLSGGLDSSTIAAVVRRLGVSHLDTFSIAFADPQFDESEHQRRMAQFLGTDHQVVQATHEDIGRAFPDVVWHTETPILRTAPVPMFLLSKLVHDRRYRVVLTGEGADEFLGGYDIFKEAMIRRFWARQPDSEFRSGRSSRANADP